MKIGVVGAGITGLATAYHLQKMGAEVTVFEASARVGGAIASHRDGDFLAEHGPHTFLDRDPAVGSLLDDLGLTRERVDANTVANKRFTVKNGVVEALPMSPPSFLKTELYSAGAKFNLLREPFIDPSDADDESVTSFVERRLGHEFLEYGVELLVNGIWAGDPNRLSVRHAFKRMYALERDFGSIVKGAMKMGRRKADTESRPHMFAFRNGNQTLVDALAGELNEIITDAPVTKLQRKDGRWTIRFRKDGGTRGRRVDAVLFTAPTWALSKIDITSDGDTGFVANLPVPINHPPLAVLTLGFRRQDVEHPLDGFGMLIPEVEQRNILGAMFTSTLFKGRAPDGHVTIANFVGGARHTDLVDLAPEKRLEMTLRELRDLLGVAGEPAWVHEHVWHQGIPQYDVGYGQNLAELQAIERRFPGLHLHGNFRDGVAVPDLIRSAQTNAQDILANF